MFVNTSKPIRSKNNSIFHPRWQLASEDYWRVNLKFKKLHSIIFSSYLAKKLNYFASTNLYSCKNKFQLIEIYKTCEYKCYEKKTHSRACEH